MIVLKNSGLGRKSEHSTFENLKNENELQIATATRQQKETRVALEL